MKDACLLFLTDRFVRISCLQGDIVRIEETVGLHLFINLGKVCIKNITYD